LPQHGNEKPDFENVVILNKFSPFFLAAFSPHLFIRLAMFLSKE